MTARSARIAACLLAALFSFAAGPTAHAENEALALARRLDQRHRALGGLSARFTQTYRSGLLGREVVERGVVQIKRPGRMRWEYHQPEKKTFVCDGTNFYFYVPADRQVIVREQAGARGLPTLLLSGQGAIADQFEVAFEAGPSAGRSLRLTPRRPDPEIESVRLDLDARERIVGLEVLDVQGNRSTFRFDDLREGQRLPDRLFRFDIPAGVEVVAG